ncbi:MAG: extracellular solute-binding protein, partial [Bulleidia sp.]|nr:extracellular solute-binding protein [Bulleidia sp.]
TVEFWYAGGKTAVGVIQDIVDKYNASQDVYEVKTVTQADYSETYQKVQAAIAGNAAPDLVLLDPSAARVLSEKSILTDLNPYTQKDETFNADDLITAFYEQGADENGKQFALPAYGTTQVLYYNVQAFKDAGVDPSSIETWQDLGEAAAKIKATGKYEYGWEPMWGPDNLIDAAFSNGASVFSADGTKVTINSKEWVDVFEQFRKWIHEDETMAIHSGGQGWEYWYATIDDVIQNKAGGYTGSSGDQADLDFNIVQAMEQPAWSSSTTSSPTATALTMSVFENSSEAEKQGAYEFLRYFMSVESQVAWNTTVGYVAVNKQILDDPTYQEFLESHPQAAVPFSQAEHASLYPVDPTNGQVYDALKIAADKIEIDNVPAQQALDEAQKTAQEALDAVLN